MLRMMNQTIAAEEDLALFALITLLIKHIFAIAAC